MGHHEKRCLFVDALIRVAYGRIRSRIDFLLLPPSGARIVIKIDGKHHYCDTEGKPSPQIYAQTMAADRSLRLAGYEVYRFGAHEFLQPNAEGVLIKFYRTLFERYSLLPVDPRATS